jgi:hypothetical protein
MARSRKRKSRMSVKIAALVPERHTDVLRQCHVGTQDAPQIGTRDLLLDVVALLARENDDDRAPSRQQDVPDCVGHGVSQNRELAFCFVLDRSQRCRDGSRPGAGA